MIWKRTGQKSATVLGYDGGRAMSVFLVLDRIDNSSASDPIRRRAPLRSVILIRQSGSPALRIPSAYRCTSPGR
jgi:hypothetical protein